MNKGRSTGGRATKHSDPQTKKATTDSMINIKDCNLKERTTMNR